MTIMKHIKKKKTFKNLSELLRAETGETYLEVSPDVDDIRRLAAILLITLLEAIFWFLSKSNYIFKNVTKCCSYAELMYTFVD